MRSLDTLITQMVYATTPPKIASVISDTNLYLRTHFADHKFYTRAFPILINKLFGFKNSMYEVYSLQDLSWVDIASSDPDLADKLFAFLSPDGTLLSSIFAFSHLSIVTLDFPINTLSEWFSFLYLNCSIYSQNLSETRILHDSYLFHPRHLILNVFQYFIFGFAYYPHFIISKYARISTTDSKFWLDYLLSFMPVISSWNQKTVEHNNDYSLYLRLLSAYLSVFMPTSFLNGHESLLHYSRYCDDPASMYADFVLKVFVNCWLLEDDISSLPRKVCEVLGVQFPFKPPYKMSWPPPSRLGAVVKLFMNHLNLSWVPFTRLEKEPDNALFYSAMFPLWTTYTDRSLYRFISRTFLLTPIEPRPCMKNISEVFSIWIDYIQPWKVIAENLTPKDGVQLSSRKYFSKWEPFVVFNSLFYTSLVMHFIGFAHKFLHTDAELIVPMVSKVIDILTSSKELLDLIKNVDSAFHSKSSETGNFRHNVYEQFQEWEDALHETDANGLKLFYAGEDGGPKLFQHFILRAEDELRSVFGGILAQNLHYIHSLKTGYLLLFGEPVIDRCPQSPLTIQLLHFCAELFNPRTVVKHKSE